MIGAVSITAYQIFLGGGQDEMDRPVVVMNEQPAAEPAPVIADSIAENTEPTAQPQDDSLPVEITADAMPAPVAELSVGQDVAEVKAETKPEVKEEPKVEADAVAKVEEQPKAEKTDEPAEEPIVAEVKPIEPVAPAPEAAPEAAPEVAPEVTQEVIPAEMVPPLAKPEIVAEKPVETIQPLAPQPLAPEPIVPQPIVPVAEAKKDVGQKTVEKMQAIQDILGEEPIVATDVKAAQNQAMIETMEVTPRAKQVIIVKRAFDRNSAQATIAAGDRVMDAGQYNDAADIYARQLKNNPSDPLALAGNALALQKAGRMEEAMKIYDRLLELNPRDIEALTNYLGLLQNQNPQQALVRLKALSEQYPESDGVAAQIGMAYARMMDTPNALRALQKAQALDPTNPTYVYNMAVLYDRLGTVEKARETYRQALDIANAYPDKAKKIPVTTIRNRLRVMEAN
jgi:Flp pilus assembly protein TadD